MCFIVQVEGSDTSLYNVKSGWKDEFGKDFSFGNMQGKKVVVAMAYTSCQGTCPMIVSKLKKIEKLFADKKISHEFIIVTFDPGFDTPAHNQEFYREKMGIKNANWHFLNGSESDTRKLSMLLDIKFAKNPKSGMIIHDNKIILLNESGEIEKRIESLEESETKLIN